MEEALKQILTKIDVLGDRISILDSTTREGFRRLDKKIDSISEVVAKTMEDVVGIKEHMEKQDMELMSLKGDR